jgi:hypothetical protein
MMNKTTIQMRQTATRIHAYKSPAPRRKAPENAVVKNAKMRSN